MGGLFNIFLTYPITNLLVAFYKLLLIIHIPFALGFSIILLTIFIGLILYPSAVSRIRTTAKMQKVGPHVAAAREKYKDDKKRQQEELMRVYREHGVNPMSGCLPMLIQFPIFISLYNVLTKIVAAQSHDALAKINNILYFPLCVLFRLRKPCFFFAFALLIVVNFSVIFRLKY